MGDFYIVDYYGDTGYDFVRDQVIIKAANEEHAKAEVKRVFGKLGNDYMVTEIISAKKWNGFVFSKKFNMK